MNTVEFGKENGQVILLLHGGGLSWWNFEQVARLLEREFHVVLPILDGHAGSDRAFTTIEDNAQAVIDEIDRRFGGKVCFMGGVSLGGQILAEVLSRRSNICRNALLESTALLPTRLTRLLVRPMLACSYGLIRRPWFSKLQARSMGIPEELQGDYYRDSCAISKESMTAFLQASSSYRLKGSIKKTAARLVLIVGGREPSVVIRSGRHLHRLIPESGLEIIRGLRHGELSLGRPTQYAEWVRTAAKPILEE